MEYVSVLPHRGLKWIDSEEFDEIRIQNIGEEADIGYIFEVDLEYPKSLYNLHNDYPLAPERVTVEGSMLST